MFTFIPNSFSFDFSHPFKPSNSRALFGESTAVTGTTTDLGQIISSKKSKIISKLKDKMGV